ncbi:potassium channel family protein [Croceicoccus sp. F390]|uniref:Potassium channel family protein n=1 Tax=Croceicoccus esteveae TaxID=3075597 RepID=A0ABU2ZJP5_9SPHN|nr:potassium channel family protein [Croceicoccus sp. F390]MDT0576835.1 potassium channel family protein [Croceicoccus sp. F390]
MTPPARQNRPKVHRPLRRRVKVPVWADIGIRISAAVGLVFFVVLIHWADRDGLVDNVDGEISFLDVVYFTMISITTTGFGDIAPVSDQARVVEALIVTPIRIAVLLIFVGTAYNFIIKRSWENWHMARIQKHLKDHVVVLGFGVSGSESVRELIARGTDPAHIVVMDTDDERLRLAEQLGCNVINADASRDEAMHDIRISKAATVLVSAGRDDASILIVLTVRHLAPDVPITVVVRAADNELLARQAGANNVLNPVRFTGLLLAGSAAGMHVADYLADLASVQGRVQLVERLAKPEDIGQPLRNLGSGSIGVRLYRGDTAYGYWEPEADSVEAGDMIVVIKPTPHSGPGVL